jgi:hypothetical protein
MFANASAVWREHYKRSEIMRRAIQFDAFAIQLVSKCAAKT